MATKKATKKTTKPAEKKVEPQASEIKPSIWVYTKATLQLASSWAKSHKLRALIGLVVIMIIIGGLSLLIRSGSAELTNDKIVVQVNKELSISGDGNPAVLSVIDKEKVEQPFLEQAKNGDKVLLYYKAGKAVLYRPSEQRIVHSGSYTPPDAKVFVRQGSSGTEPVESVEDLLKRIKDIDVVSRDKSTRSDYKGVTIVNVTDRYDEKVQEIAKDLNAEISRLPAGETFPDADILIIVGE